MPQPLQLTKGYFALVDDEDYSRVARFIRAAAEKQDRTVNGYVLHCLHNRMRIKARMEEDFARVARQPTAEEDQAYLGKR